MQALYLNGLKRVRRSLGPSSSLTRELLDECGEKKGEAPKTEFGSFQCFCIAKLTGAGGSFGDATESEREPRQRDRLVSMLLTARVRLLQAFCANFWRQKLGRDNNVVIVTEGNP
jgi:hypothetical protein